MIGLSYKTGNTYISSTSINTYSTKCKHVDEIKLLGCYDLIGVKTYMVPTKNYFGLLNLFFCQIFKNGNHNKLTLLDV